MAAGCYVSPIMVCFLDVSPAQCVTHLHSGNSWELQVKNTFVHFKYCIDDDDQPVLEIRSVSEPTVSTGLADLHMPSSSSIISSQRYTDGSGRPLTSKRASSEEYRVIEPTSLLALPSIGSEGHDLGTCRPCAWHWKAAGCSKESGCEFCHLCSEEDFKRRKAQRMAAVRNSHKAKHRTARLAKAKAIVYQ